MIKELLKRVRDTLQELEETHYDLYWDIQTALEQNEQEDAYAWSSVADYEKEVGFEVSDAFKAAWAMARTRLSYESTTPAAQTALEPVHEPVAWMYEFTGDLDVRLERTGRVILLLEKQDWVESRTTGSYVESPLYTSPPKREPPQTAREMYQRGYAAAERGLKREPLSKLDIFSLIKKSFCEINISTYGLARAIEKAHGIGGEE